MAQNLYLDDWAILGVPPGSDQDAIRKAYRKQALLHHPDKGGDPAKFRQVAEAYVALSEASGAATPRSTRTDYATADPYEIFARFFGAAPASGPPRGAAPRPPAASTTVCPSRRSTRSTTTRTPPSSGASPRALGFRGTPRPAGTRSSTTCPRRTSFLPASTGRAGSPTARRRRTRTGRPRPPGPTPSALSMSAQGDAA